MSVWVFIWLILSAALLFFSFWTLIILMRQKKSWEAFAKRHALRFTRGSFLESPTVSGIYKGYAISLFTGEHRQEDARKNRKLTAIELELSSVMPMSGATASGGMIPLLDRLNHNAELKPIHKEWQDEYIIRTDNLAMMEAYMSADRVAALVALMKVVNAWVIFVFLENSTLLRMDLPNPLEEDRKMDVLLNKMVEVAQILELKKGEAKRLETLRNKELSQNGTTKIMWDDVKSDSDLGLELDEDKDDDEKDSVEAETVSEEKEAAEEGGLEKNSASENEDSPKDSPKSS